MNMSLETGFVKKQIKIYEIIPFYKNGSGDTNKFYNYTPILISSSCEIIQTDCFLPINI